MTIQEALEKLQGYEKATFALNHATGLMYYDGATIAPKGTTELRGSTLGELSRMGYELTTAPETMEMLRTLMENREELEPITRRKAEELWRDYDRTHRVPVAEYVAYQELSAKSDAVWHEAKEKNDFALFEPYLQQMFDASRRMAGYWEPEKDPYETMLSTFERGLTVAQCDAFFSSLREKLVPLIQQVTAHADRVDDAPLHRDYPVAIQRQFSDFIMDVMDIDRDHCIIGETEHPFTINFSRVRWPPPCIPWSTRAATPSMSSTPAGSWLAPALETASPWASTRVSPGSMRTSSAAAGPSAPSCCRG